jgi:hypothetical protein
VSFIRKILIPKESLRCKNVLFSCSIICQNNKEMKFRDSFRLVRLKVIKNRLNFYP